MSIVRFSPNGRFLATAGDDHNILIHKQSGSSDWSEWLTHKRLPGHLEDVCDLAWSPCGTQLISGSVDNFVFVWDVQSGTKQEVKKHSHYVQGVAWSPCGQFIASQSSDRSCIVQRSKGQGKWEPLVELSKLPDGKSMFCGEDCPTFFRRLSFSPDGTLLFCPTGCMNGDSDSTEDKECELFTNARGAVTNNNERDYCAFVMCQGALEAPALQLPGFKKPVISIRCSS